MFGNDANYHRLLVICIFNVLLFLKVSTFLNPQGAVLCCTTLQPALKSNLILMLYNSNFSLFKSINSIKIKQFDKVLQKC